MVKLSIISINYNNRDGLLKTIQSIINQTYKDYEYLIIDGGSTDGSTEVIKKYAENLAYWVSEPDNGIFHAMNKGIRKSSGEYLMFLNSGDWLVDENVLFKVFSKPRDADILYGHMNFVSQGISFLRRAADESQLSLAYFFTNSICHQASFISRRLFKNSLYDESYRIAGDKKFFIEKIIFNNCTLQMLDEIITNFNKEGISYKPENKKLIKYENQRIFSDLLPPRVLKDISLLKNNYTDIKSLIKIKKYKILYFFFIGLKRTATFFRKYLKWN